MSGEPRETLGEVLEVISPLSEQDRRPLLLERLDDVIEDEAIPLRITSERGIEFLDAGSLGQALRREPRLWANGRCAVSILVSPANLTGPSCIQRIGCWPSRLCGVAVSPTTYFAFTSPSTRSKLAAGQWCASSWMT